MAPTDLGRELVTVSADSRSELLLEVEDLVVHYRIRRGWTGALLRRPKRIVRAVDGLSLTLRRGEMLAVVGESGCGKTTTALALLRMIKPTAGSILFEGQDISRLRARRMRNLRRHIQMIYQDPYESLNPRRTVRQTIEEPLLVHGVGSSKPQRSQRVVEALEAAELSPPSLYLDRYPEELSGGQRQRVAIAASLVLSPDLLVADEPVSMLDVSVRAEILALFDRLRRVDGMGIVMITHDLSTAAHFADRIAVLYLGRIVEEGPARSVVRDPRHPYTKALLSVVPSLHRNRREEMQLLRGEPPDPTRIPDGCRFEPRCPLAVQACLAIDPPLLPRPGQSTDEHQAACIMTSGSPDERVEPARP